MSFRIEDYWLVLPSGRRYFGPLAPKRTVGRTVYSRKLYAAWKNMLYRCENPECKCFPRYGGRGISVCKRWHTFSNFALDMGEPPTSGHSIDRKDGTGNYSPRNCRWATRREQCQNFTRAEQWKQITFTRVARDLGMSITRVSQVLNGHVGKYGSRTTLARALARITQLLNDGWQLTPHRRSIIFPEQESIRLHRRGKSEFCQVGWEPVESV